MGILTVWTVRDCMLCGYLVVHMFSTDDFFLERTSFLPELFQLPGQRHCGETGSSEQEMGESTSHVGEHG